MTIQIPRALSPGTNPAGLLAIAGAVYAAAVMLTNWANHHGVIDPAVIVAAVAAVGSLLTRQAVTPVADPKDGIGRPLAAVPDAPLPPYPVTTAPAAAETR